VRMAFDCAPRLDDVFTLRSDFSLRRTGDLSWQQENFELVALSKSGNEWKISVVTPSSGPSSNVGFIADTDDDVLKWISENKECYAFCFPTVHAGPDIFFYIRSKKTQKLLLVAMQAKHYKAVEKSSLNEGVRTVTPSWFWKSKDQKFKSPEEIPSSEIADSFCNTLLQIENTITVQDASYPILRVFASWPADAQIERTLECKASQKKKKKKQKKAEDDEDVDTQDPDLHPLAVLHKVNFANINNELGKSSFRGVVEQREVVFAKRQYLEQMRKLSSIQE